MGNTQERICQEAKRPAMAERVGAGSLRAPEIREAAGIGTTLRRCTRREYDLLFTHGYQVADATLAAYGGAFFEPRPLATTELGAPCAAYGDPGVLSFSLTGRVRCRWYLSGVRWTKWLARRLATVGGMTVARLERSRFDSTLSTRNGMIRECA